MRDFGGLKVLSLINKVTISEGNNLINLKSRYFGSAVVLKFLDLDQWNLSRTYLFAHLLFAEHVLCAVYSGGVGTGRKSGSTEVGMATIPEK